MSRVKKLAERVMLIARNLHGTLRLAREAMTGEEVRAVLTRAEREVDTLIEVARAAAAEADQSGPRP